MLLIALVLIVVGVLLFAFVHPADRNGVRARNVGAGALIVAGLVLLVIVLAGALDTETDVDAELAAPLLGLARLRAWARRRAGLDVDRRDPSVLVKVGERSWALAEPLPEPKAWALWRFLGLMPRPTARR